VDDAVGAAGEDLIAAVAIEVGGGHGVDLEAGLGEFGQAGLGHDLHRVEVDAVRRAPRLDLEAQAAHGRLALEAGRVVDQAILGGLVVAHLRQTPEVLFEAIGAARDDDSAQAAAALEGAQLP